MPETVGEQVVRPAIAIFWNPESQSIELSVDREQIRHPSFGRALLEMATQVMKDHEAMHKALAMKQAQQEAQENQRLANLLRKR